MSILKDWWQRSLLGLLLITTITSRFGYAPNEFWYNAGLILPVGYVVVCTVAVIAGTIYIFKAAREPLPIKT